MADTGKQDLRLTAGLDAEGVVAGVKEIEGSADAAAVSVAKMGDSATAGLKEAEPAAESLRVAIEEVEAATKALDSATTQLGVEEAAKAGAEAMAKLAVEAKAASAAGQGIDQAEEAMERYSRSVVEASGKMEKLPTGLTALEAAARRAEQSVEALGAAQGPRKISAAIAVASDAADDLRSAIAGAAAAGEKIDDAAVVALQRLEQSMEKAAGKAGRLGDAVADLRQRGKLGAEGFQAAAGAAGSFDGMLNGLADTSGKAGEMVGKAGVAVGGVAAAFMTGYAAGEKIRDLFKDITGKELPNLSAKVATLVTDWRALGDVIDGTNKAVIDSTGHFDKQASVLDKIAWALKTQVGSVTGLGAAHDVLTEKTKAYLEQGKIDLEHKEKARYAYDAAAKSMRQLFGGFEDAGAKTAALTKQGEAMDKWIANSIATGEDWKKGLEENKEKLSKWIEELEKAPDVLAQLPPRVKEAIDYIRSLGSSAVESAHGLRDLRKALDDIGKVPAGKAIDDIADAIGKAKAEGKDWQPVLEKHQGQLEKLYTQAKADGYSALEGLRTKIMDTIPAWQASEMVNKEYEKQLAKNILKLNEFGRTLEQQKAFDQNTADLQRSVDALKAQDQALRDGMDAWATAGQAMGTFSVAVRTATEGYVSSGNAYEDMVEAIARANDTLGENAVFMGSWLAELERGNITVDEFRKRLDDASTGLVNYSAILRASGVDAADAQQAISDMYHALNDVTFMEPAIDFWGRFGIVMGRTMTATKALRQEMAALAEQTVITAGIVNEAIGGDRGSGEPGAPEKPGNMR